MNVKNILSCTNLEDDWFYEDLRQWANTRSFLPFDFPKKVLKPSSDNSKMSDIIKAVSFGHKQIMRAPGNVKWVILVCLSILKKYTETMRKKYFEVPIIMSNLGPVDTVKGFFLLVVKERYPQLKEFERDVVKLDIGAMNLDPCYLHVFNLAKDRIVAEQTKSIPHVH